MMASVQKPVDFATLNVLKIWTPNLFILPGTWIAFQALKPKESSYNIYKKLYSGAKSHLSLKANCGGQCDNYFIL